MLYDQLVRVKNGSQEDMEALVIKFMPLIKRYSRKLFWEDAQNDLTVAFLEVIVTMNPDRLHCRQDGALVNYIVHSLHNCYIKLLDAYFNVPKANISLEEFTEKQTLDAASDSLHNEEEEFFDLLSACPSLTARERNVLTLVYLYGYSSANIANKLSTSRQNVNQIKRRALAKLRRFL